MKLLDYLIKNYDYFEGDDFEKILNEIKNFDKNDITDFCNIIVYLKNFDNLELNKIFKLME